MAVSPPPSMSHIPPHFSSGSFPVIVIAVIGILATGFLLVGYYLFVIKCCLNWHRIDVLNRFSSRRRTAPADGSPANFAAGDAADNAKGLDEAIIRSIPVIKFRKLPEKERENTNSNNAGNRKPETASSYECAVCLSEFEDEERLRVIPNCCHAFHIDCIDIWLQSNANCPLCRSWISPSSILHNDRLFLGSSSSPETSAAAAASGDDGVSDDEYVVIEIRDNNLDEPRLVSENKNNSKNKKKVFSMGDEWIEMKREKDEEFRIVQPIRRSISMDLSADREFCAEIQQQCGALKEVSEIICSDSIRDCSSSSSNNGGKIRRSIFSFGYYGRNNSRGSVQPLHLSP